MFKRKNVTISVAILLFAIICYFPLFLHLTSYPIRIWDEARLAMNAYGIFHGGNWIVVPYEGVPDLICTKPPLMIWLQTFSIFLFGFNEFSIRFPAALMALLTCAVLFIFCYRYLKKPALAFISVLVLVTSTGYIKEHVARTGDYDSLLILLTTIYLLCYFIFIETDDKKRKSKFLLCFFIACTLSVLCKGIEGLMFTPALLIYTLIRGKFIALLKKRNLYFGISMLLILGVGYYFLRETMNPGYIKTMWKSEVNGSFNGVIDGHEGPFSFYWQLLTGEDYIQWYYFVPFGVLIGLFQVKKRLRNFTLFLFIAIGEYFLVISIAQTKNYWYEAPLFPLLALVVGIFIEWIFLYLNDNETLNRNFKIPIAGFILIAFLFTDPYLRIINYNLYFAETPGCWPYEIEYYLKFQLEHNKKVGDCKYIFSYCPTGILFYSKIFEESGQHILQTQIDKLKVGDKVIVNEDNLITEMKSKFNIELLETFQNVKVYKILSKI